MTEQSLAKVYQKICRTTGQLFDLLDWAHFRLFNQMRKVYVIIPASICS